MTFVVYFENWKVIFFNEWLPVKSMTRCRHDRCMCEMSCQCSCVLLCDTFGRHGRQKEAVSTSFQSFHVQCEPGMKLLTHPEDAAGLSGLASCVREEVFAASPHWQYVCVMFYNRAPMFRHSCHFTAGTRSVVPHGRCSNCAKPKSVLRLSWGGSSGVSV